MSTIINKYNQTIPKEPVMVLLRMVICEPDRQDVMRIRNLYVFVEQTYHTDMRVDSNLDGMKYLYEQHQCPTNFIRGTSEFVIETSPGMYDRDPHGLFTVVGWITKAEMQAMTGEDPGNNANLAAVIEKVIAEFKEPPADWMVEAGLEEEPENQRSQKFLARWKEMVLEKIKEDSGNTVDKFLGVTDVELQGLRNNTLPMIKQMDLLARLSEHFAIQYSFI